MKHAIIILNYNNAYLCVNCVKTLRTHNIMLDVMLVDNKSTDDSAKVLNEYIQNDKHCFLCVTNKNGGYSYGNNFGIKKLIENGKSYDFFTILNPDVEIHDGEYFKKIEAGFKNNRIAVLTGKQVLNGKNYNEFTSYWNLPNVKETILENSFLNYFYKRRPETLEIHDGIGITQVVSGCCFTIRAKALEKVNFFDEGVFLYYEENILGVKLIRQGLVEGICLNTCFYHNHRKSKDITIKKEINNKKITIRSKNYFIKKYLTKNYFALIGLYFFDAIDFVLSTIIFILKRFLKRHDN